MTSQITPADVTTVLWHQAVTTHVPGFRTSYLTRTGATHTGIWGEGVEGKLLCMDILCFTVYTNLHKYKEGDVSVPFLLEI